MPLLPIYTTNENGIPLNDLELYIDGVLVDADFDYGESYNFPCGNPFLMQLRRNLWFGANEVICHNNPSLSNNDSVSSHLGVCGIPPTCLFPSNPHTPFNNITVNINGNIYTQTYNYYTPSINTMLNDVAVLINADTATTFWEAIVEGDCLRIRKTRYTANTYNGQTYTVTIHREFPAVQIVTSVPTGGQTGDPCEPFNPIDYDECLFTVIWREPQEDFTQTLIVDTDEIVPFEFENTLYFPCCQSWTIGNNDNDQILEAGELNPMYIILATPDFEGAIANFYLVKEPCSNRVCAYEMTNIPYCLYEYNYNVTPNQNENIILRGRNTCYEYACADIYTIGLRVVRCSEELIQYLNYCGCGIETVTEFEWIEDIDYQMVETDNLYPDILELLLDRPNSCDYLCQECNVYCKTLCYLEQDTFTIRYVWEYPCCNDPVNNTATINVYDNGTMIYTTTLNSGNTATFNYTWNNTGLHEITLEAITCCGTFKKVYKYYVVPCKPYDLNFDWTIDCDCNYKGSNSAIRECNCVPVNEEITFTPQYILPDCGCPIECEDIILDPVNEDVFTEQDNGNNLGALAIQKNPIVPLSYTSPYPSWFVLSDATINSVLTTTPITSLNPFGNTGTGLNITYNGLTPPATGIRNGFLGYKFQNSYSIPATYTWRLEFLVQFRYQNIPFGSYPSYALKPNFPLRILLPNAMGSTTPYSPVPYTSRSTVTFAGTHSEYYNEFGTYVSDFVTGTGGFVGTNLPFDPTGDVPAYRMVVNGTGGTDIEGIRLDIEYDLDLFENNQYIFQILISEINLIVTSPGGTETRCFKEGIVRWYVDGQKVHEVNITQPNYNGVDDRLFYKFNKGCHLVKLEVENCAGACSIEKELCAGDSITLSKEQCYEWKIEDCKQYQQCYTDTETPTVLNVPMRYKELNVFLLPPNIEWIHLEPHTHYYDKQNDVYFLYRGNTDEIMPYTDLYNTALPHTNFIYIVNRIEGTATPINGGNAIWFCKWYEAVVELYDIKDNLIDSYPFTIKYYTGENIHLPINKDGIYKVKLTVYSYKPNAYNVEPIPYEKTIECEYEWYLIELCGIYKCYEEMFMKLQCEEKCECPNPQKIKEWREKINVFMAFLNLLNMAVEGEFSMYSVMNSIILDKDRIANANFIQEQIDAIRELCNDCGCYCKETKQGKPYCKSRISFTEGNNNTSHSTGCGCFK